NDSSNRPGGPGGPRRPTVVRSPEPGRPRRRVGWGWIVSGIILAIILIPSLFADLITDWMWFDSQQLAQVYTTRLFLSVGVFFLAGIVAALFAGANWMYAWRATRTDILFPGQREQIPRGLIRAAIILTAIVVGLIMGLAASGEW